MLKLIIGMAIWFGFCISADASSVSLPKVIENHRFLFKLPLDFNEVDVQGIDSFVKVYESDTIRLSLDYGWYSNSFGNWPENTVYEEAVIFGRSARIGTANSDRGEFQYITQVYFNLENKLKLSMSALCKTMGDVTIAHAVFKTILFKGLPDIKQPDR